MSPLTWRKYAYTLGLWLNFLHVLGCSWDCASEDDAECFKEWRLTEEANPRVVEGSTFSVSCVARGQLVLLSGGLHLSLVDGPRTWLHGNRCLWLGMGCSQLTVWYISGTWAAG
jgi:hypothetical protein